MCENCWAEAGSPRIDNEKVRAVQPLIAAVYKYSHVGGNLHIVLDDFNVRDRDLECCQKIIADGGVLKMPAGSVAFLGVPAGTPETDPVSGEQLHAELTCLEALRAMTVEERASAIALFDGFWS